MAAPFPSFTSTWHADTYAGIDPKRPELSLTGKSIVITGGGSGIGGAIANSIAKAGASRIAIIGRRPEILASKKIELQALSPSSQILTIGADISNEQEISSAFAKIKSSFGPLDILISNAAYFGGATPVLEDNIQEYFTSFEVNVKGTFLTTKAFLANSVIDATILNITTAITHIPAEYFPGFSAYASSKMASTIYLNYVQAENPKLHVIQVHPGQVLTDMSAKVGRSTTIDTGTRIPYQPILRV
jgi:NAD(P)-dependent dehydrogenase (short-subunit alcohol dehydrogenase family)